MEAWKKSLAPAVSLHGSPHDGDVLRFILQRQTTYIHELTSWPFLQAVMQGSDESPSMWQRAAQSLSLHLERLIINSTGFSRRQRGTWLMLRSSARSARILLSFASTATRANLLPVDWRSTVEAISQILQVWVDQLEALRKPIDLMQELLKRVDSLRPTSTP